MYTRSKRRRVEEDKGEGEEEIDQGILERAMMEHYQEEYERRSPIVSMIVYRMNVWKGIEDPNILVPGDKMNFKSNIPSVLDEYGGRKDFGVEIYPGGAGRKPYTLQASPPINRAPPRCQITGSTYLDDYIWIENLNSEHGIFVNEKKISNLGKYMLVDGDIVGLGAPHTSTKHFWGEDKEKRGLVLKVKNLRIGCKMDEADDVANPSDEPSPAYLAFNNVVIVDKILKFLSHEELKTARVVNKFWMKSASRLFFPRTCIKLFGNFWNLGNGYTTEELINEHKIQNWKIHFDKHSRRVQSLVKEKGRIVRTLVLSFTVKSQKDLTKAENLLSYFPNLEVLKLRMSLHGFSILKFSSTFESVKELDVEYPNFRVTTEQEEKYGLFSFSKPFPNLRSFYYKKKGCPTPTPFLTSVSDCVRDHPLSLWSRLTHISAYFDDRVMQAIGTIKQNLTSLEIKDVSWSMSNSMSVLNSIMEKHAPTLEHLALQSNWDDFSEKVSLVLPRCPKLKTLEVDVTEAYFFNKRLPPPVPDILFPAGSSICYETDFPQLQTLSLMTLTKKRGYSNEMDKVRVDIQPVLDAFVPKDSDTVCKTMRWINFKLPEEKCGKNNAWFKDFVGRFHRMFPHVHHPQIIQGRKLFNLE